MRVSPARFAAALFAALLLPVTAQALEKRAVAFDGDPANDDGENQQVGVGDVSTQPASWGSIKGLYR